MGIALLLMNGLWVGVLIARIVGAAHRTLSASRAVAPLGLYWVCLLMGWRLRRGRVWKMIMAALAVLPMALIVGIPRAVVVQEAAQQPPAELPGWQRPVELDRDAGFMPLEVHDDGSNVTVVYLRAGEKRQNPRLRVVRSADRGRTWKSTADMDLSGRMRTIPAVLMWNDRLCAVLGGEGEDKSAFVRTIGLRDGRASEERRVDLGAPLYGEVFPVLRRVGDLYYLLYATHPDVSVASLVLARSTDGGASWTRISESGWKHDRWDSVPALLIALEKALHVFCRESGESSRITHYVSRDGGRTWSKQEVRTALRATKWAPIAAASHGGRLYLTVVAWEESGEGKVYLLCSTDDGKSWIASRGICDAEVDDNIFLLSRLAVAGESAAFWGLDSRMAGKLWFSCDSGSSWSEHGLSRHLKGSTSFVNGTFSTTGDEFFSVLVNGPDQKDLGKGCLLFRRWGLPDEVALPPLSDAETQQFHQWVDRLADPDIAVREQAADDIVKLGERALPLVERAVEQAQDTEVRERLRSLRPRLFPEWWEPTAWPDQAGK
ncbi:MAG: exo-alpha-sialidase [Planctomycetes bacterium]|nr:exo-alpha-sialidase [Planctomycetota bacterium]